VVNSAQSYEASALSLFSFVITWAAMMSLLFVGRGRQVQVGGAR
jgi:hypothetical protein